MNRTDCGFTILETLVAFAILASVLVALYAAGGLSLRLIAQGGEMRTAAMLAQSKLDEIAAVPDPLPASASGMFSGSDVSWRIEAHDLGGTMAGPSPYRLQDVRLVLTWHRGTTSQSWSTVTRHLGSVRP